MAEAQETVQAEGDAGAAASAAESKVAGAVEVTGEALDTATTAGAASSTSKVQQQQQQQSQLQHLPR
jgi:hypothetical protein